MIHLRPIEYQTTLLPEVSIDIIPNELLETFISLTDQHEKTLSVSHLWHAHTLKVFKSSKIQELTQTLQLIIEQLNPQEWFIPDFARLQQTYQSRFEAENTFVKAQKIFLSFKSQFILTINDMPPQEELRIRTAIGHQLPNSIKNIFEIAPHKHTVNGTINLELFPLLLQRCQTLSLATFFTLLQSYQPLLPEDRSAAVVHFVGLLSDINKIEYIKLLLADGPISEECRGLAIWDAAKNKNLEIAKLLLANGPISIKHRESAVCNAAIENCPKIVNLLLANGPISEEGRGCAIWEAAIDKNLEIAKLLLANGPISIKHRGSAVYLAASEDSLKIVNFLQANGLIPTKHREIAVCGVAHPESSLEIIKLLLASGPISKADQGCALGLAKTTKNLEIIQLLSEPWVTQPLRQRKY